MSGEYGTVKKKTTVKKTEQPFNYSFWIKIVIALFAIITIALFANSYLKSNAEQKQDIPDETMNPKKLVSATGGLGVTGLGVNATPAETEKGGVATSTRRTEVPAEFVKVNILTEGTTELEYYFQKQEGSSSGLLKIVSLNTELRGRVFLYKNDERLVIYHIYKDRTPIIMIPLPDKVVFTVN